MDRKTVPTTTSSTFPPDMDFFGEEGGHSVSSVGENGGEMRVVSGGKRSLEQAMTKPATPPQASSSLTVLKESPDEELGSVSDSDNNDKTSTFVCSSNSYPNGISKRRKLSRTQRPSVVDNHYHKIRSLIDAGDRWEIDLERIHGLTDEQAYLCVSIAAEHFHSDRFPPSDGNLFLELAREGWDHLKELDRLTKLSPECH